LRVEESFHGLGHLAEAADGDAHLPFLDPAGVVALVRQSPGIALHDDGQSLGQGFADAAGAGFADEEIGDLHVERDVARESLDEHGNVRRHGAQLGSGALMASAKQNQLRGTAGTVERAGDLHHFHGAFAAE